MLILYAVSENEAEVLRLYLESRGESADREFIDRPGSASADIAHRRKGRLALQKLKPGDELIVFSYFRLVEDGADPWIVRAAMQAFENCGVYVRSAFVESDIREQAEAGAKAWLN